MLNKRKLTYRVLISMLLLAIVLAFIILHGKQEEMKVVFLDVGQGDSILISQGSKQVLIDGGKDGKLLLEKLGKHIPFWDRKIEMVIETHPDADHIGGLIEIFRAYEIGAVMKTGMQSQSQTFKTLEEAIENEKSDIIEAVSGQKIIFANKAEAEVLFPFQKIEDVDSKDTNAASVVLKMKFGENSFLFTGDLPSEQEQVLIEKGAELKSDILKVSHHGSKYSSSTQFLEKVSPEDAIISVGKNNSYGHPNQEALQRISKQSAKIFKTNEDGDIIYNCRDITSRCVLQN